MTITARFPSTCTACKKRINAGESIEWTRGVKTVQHTDCSSTSTATLGSTHRPSRFPSRYGSNYARFSSGAETFTNKAGRCEDAPCCGCCS
jgi:hypothetical protein